MITTTALSMRIVVLLLIVICNCCITMLNSMNLNYNLFFRRLSSASYLQHDHHLTGLTSTVVDKKEIVMIIPARTEMNHKGDAFIHDASILSTDVKLISTESSNTKPSTASSSDNKHITGKSNQLLC